MSGGSWDYAYHKVEEIAAQCERSDDPKRLALGKKLRLIATALHAMEWVDSGDWASGDDEAALNQVVSPSEVLECISTRAEIVLAQLTKSIAEAKKALKR